MRLILFFIICFFSLGLQAQQWPTYTIYRNAPISPASLPTDYMTYQSPTSVNLGYRMQWLGYDFGGTTPRTGFLQGTHLNEETGLLLGGHILSDHTGPIGFTGFYAKGGYVLSPFGDREEGGVSFGLSMGLVQYRANTNKITFVDGDDAIPLLDHNKWFFDGALGIQYYQRVNSGDYAYGGISIPQLFGLNLLFKSSGEDFDLRRVQHLYANGGYILYLQDATFVEFSTLMKWAPNSPFNADANVRLQFDHYFWVGGGGNTSGAMHLEAGVVFSEESGVLSNGNIKIGYGFSYGFRRQFGFELGATHEFNIGYSF